MADLDRVKRNVTRMVSLNAPETDIDSYIASEGATLDQVRAHKATPKPAGPGIVASSLEGVGQGLSFGFLDEAEGAVRAGINKIKGDQRSFGELYDEGVAVPRSRIAAAKEANPVAFTAGELGAGVAMPGGLARLGIRGALARSSGAGLGARSWAGAKEGAAYGAAYGFGTGEGLEGSAKGLGSGLVTGGLVGAAVPGAVDALGAVKTWGTAPVRAWMNPQGVAAEKLGEAIARDFPQGGAGRFAAKFDNMAAANPEARMIDAGGENVRGLMRSANNMPNDARETVRRTVDARQAKQTTRIEEDLAQGFRQGRNYYDSIDTLAKKMDDIGSNAIQPALKHETPMTPQLRGVLDRPTAKELKQIVERKLMDEGQPVGFETRTAMLHRLKVELDDQIGMSVKAEKMGNRPQAGMDTRTLTILKRDLMNAIDNPGYKNALKQYASQARLQNAAEEGYESFNKKQPEEIRDALKALGNNVEREFFRMGVQRAIVERVRKGNANNDRTASVFSSPEMRLKLEAALPDVAALRAFRKQIAIEARMADSRRALQGNSTTAKQLTEGAEAGKTANMVSSAMNAASGNPQSVLNFVAQGMNRFSGLTPRVAGEIMEQGMSKDPRATDRLLREQIARAAQTPQRRAQTSQQAIAALLSGTESDLGLFGTVRPDRR
jgi:hypothetical protein